MSSNILFKTPGRNTNYMPIDINASKEEILELYARQSFSTNPENSWPYASPLAGYYDVKNSDTKLIVLNNNRKWSHLRGKTSSKRESLGKDKYYDWVEREHEQKKQQEQQMRDGNLNNGTSARSRRTTDPGRHFSHIGCTYRDPNGKDYLNQLNRSPPTRFSARSARYRSAKPRISVSMTSKDQKMSNEEEQELIDYLNEIGKRTTGLQDKTRASKPPSEFQSSYNINHPGFNRGQRLFVKDLCNVYSVKDLKAAKYNRYLSILHKQIAIDSRKKDKYKLHPYDDFESYHSYITQPRPVPNQINCGFIDPRKPSAASLERQKLYNRMYASQSAMETHSRAKSSTNKEATSAKSPSLIQQYIKSKSDDTTQARKNSTTSSSSSNSNDNNNNNNNSFAEPKYTESFDKSTSSKEQMKNHPSRKKIQSASSSLKSTASSNKNSSIPQSRTSPESLSKQESKASDRSTSKESANKNRKASRSRSSTPNNKRSTSRSRSDSSKSKKSTSRSRSNSSKIKRSISRSRSSSPKNKINANRSESKISKNTKSKSRSRSSSPRNKISSNNSPKSRSQSNRSKNNNNNKSNLKKVSISSGSTDSHSTSSSSDNINVNKNNTAAISNTPWMV